ncbi:MAG: hypothetical protein Terrestrivirus5_129 [Terrestrivirus sp.]|uniref:Uncharacterized protein n=1 Tax=Terrestrivirus sp. TaxID=2487775 RepID=A0A3G4ZN56_9VIRU|nr:MAG: hypothetical protein Terrestrivirus5_129 [Terrestrivirus sp.]
MVTINSSQWLNFITIISTWVYNVIEQTKKKSPMFIISLHIFVSNIVFSSSNEVNPGEGGIIAYLVILGVVCLLWEFGYALYATYDEKFMWYTEISFALFTTMTGFFNLCALALFSTQGVPLDHLVPLSRNALTVVAASVIVINYLVDLIEQKFWPASWQKMYNVMTTAENKVINELNVVNPVTPTTTTLTTLTTDITNTINMENISSV